MNLSISFAHVAKLTEIEENDYNLNIPRYVDTFEEEEPVDLDAVASDLAELETKMQSVDADIEGFCFQLNIKAPFLRKACYDKTSECAEYSFC